jgi:hypothetical protein
MKKLIPAILIFVFFSGGLKAVTVQIGSGTATTEYLPLYTCYGYSYSQQIYLASEISGGGGEAGIINKIRFYYSGGGTDYTQWRNWKILLGNTTKTAYNSPTDWIPQGSMTQVFNGNIPTPVAGTWLEINLSTPFSYSGGNLVVAVDENSPGYSCSAAWRSFNAGTNRGILYYSDTFNPDPASPPAANYGPGPDLAQIQLEMTITSPYLSVTPGSLAFGYIPAGSQSASQSYILSGGNLVNNSVTITAPAEFEVSVNNSTWSASVNISFTPPTFANTTIYVRFVPVSENTDYSANVTNICGTASRNLEVTGSTALYKFYCTSYSTYPGYIGIGNVTLGTLDNNSTCSTTGGPGSTLMSYSNYTMTVAPADLAMTMNVPFSVDVIKCDIYDLPSCIAIYIDYNQNGVFTDAGEQVYLSSTYSTGAFNETGTITIPPGATPGNTMMRVVDYYTTTPGSVVPCGIYYYGETEDYLVNITAAPTCIPPGYLLASAYGYQANISWTELGSATSWDVEWGPAPFTPTGSPTFTGLTSPDTLLTGLTPSTSYTYYVRSDCGSGSYSSWNGPLTFSTTVSCPAPSDLVSSAITTTGATINWTPTGLETTWDIEYGLAGFTPGSGTGYTEIPGTSSKPLDLTGLAHSSNYEFSVRAVCGTGDSSIWSLKGTFSTLCDFVTSFPWTEGFEGMPTVGEHILPNCWSYENVVGSWGPSSSTTVDYAGGPHAGTHFIETNIQNTTWVFTPGMHLEAGVTYEFSFYMMDKYITDPINFNMDVAYGSSNHAVGMTQTLASGIVCNNSAYSQFTYAVIPDTTGNYYFGIKSMSDPATPTWTYLSFDDFSVATTFCPSPTTVTATGVSNNSIDAGWTGTCTNVQFDYGAVGHAAGTGTITGTVTANPYTINGLTPNTSYELYVRQDCGGGVFSIWQGPVMFTTLCDPFPSPFEEHFTAPVIPTCWSVSGPMNWDFQHVSPSPEYYAYFANDHTSGGGGNFAWVGGSGNAGLTGITLLSPTISTSALTDPQLRFYLFNNNGLTVNPIDNQKLTVNLFDGTTWHPAIFTWDYNQNAAGWQEIIVDLAPYASSGIIQLSFVVDRGTGNPSYDDLLIDDIYVEEAPACPHPTALGAIAYGTTASLVWTSSADTFDIEFDTTGFTPTGKPTYSGVANGFTVSPLIPQTSYSYFVRAICPPLTSTWAGPYTFTTPCLTVTTPLAEDFEGCIEPECWTNIPVLGIYKWSIGCAGRSGFGIGYGSAGAMIFYQNTNSIYDLITPVFDATPLTLPKLRFDYAYAARQSGYDEMDVYYSTDAGHSWSLLLPMSGAPDSVLNTAGTLNYYFIPYPDQWASITLPLPAGTNRIKFRAISNFGNNLYLDNIKIFQPLAHDVATMRFDFGGAANLGFTPKAAVKNEGTNEEDFGVTLTVGAWTSTKQVTGLAPDSTRQVIFDACPLAAGDYPVSICTQLGTDENIANDCKTDTIKLLNLNKQVFAYCNGPGFGSTIPIGPVSFNLNDPGTLNSIANQQAYVNQPISGTWANAIWYAHAYYTDFMTLDPESGERTLITDYDHNIDGMAYDIANSILYGVYQDSLDPITKFYHSTLFSIDMTTGQKTYIGRTADNIRLINLAIDNAGDAYSVDGRSAKLGSINLSTGQWTEIGPIGFYPGYNGFGVEQGMEFDHETGNLYMCAFNSSLAQGELRLVNTVTGGTLLIGAFNSRAHLTAFGIPYSLLEHDVTAYSFDSGGAVNLGFDPKATVKNLGSATEDFNVTLTIGTWTSTKQVTGLASNAPRQVTFDACPLASGDYPVSICTQLGTDMQTSNDCLTGTVKVLNLNRKAYAFSGYDPSAGTIFRPVTFNLSTPATMDTIGNPPPPGTLGITGGTCANGTWYSCAPLEDGQGNFSHTQFITIDTLTGARTVLNPDMGARIVDISYNQANNTMYGVSDSARVKSSLYTINMATGAITLIGTQVALLNSLAIDYAGNAYAVDSHSGYFGSVDLSTGDWDPIGKIGFNADFLNNLEFDRRSGNLFLIVFHLGGVELRLVNADTGGSLFVGKFSGFGGIGALAIPYYPVAHDAAPARFDFGQVATLGFTPLVTVMNEGTNSETFDVTLTIGTWTSTKTVNSLAPNALLQVAFDACPLDLGDYSVNVCTQLVGDMNTTNDCKTRMVKLLDLNRVVFGYATPDTFSQYGPVSFNLGSPGTLNHIAPHTYNPLMGGAWVNGTWYATTGWNEPDGIFCKIDPLTGDKTDIGTTGKSFSGIAFNPVDSKMYAMRYDFLSTHNSSLYTINMETGAPSRIGPSVTGVNSLAIDNGGNAFGVNVLTNQLGSINLATGAWTVIGDIGFEAYIGENLAFDQTTGNLFMCTQELPWPGFTRLRWVNTSTGATIRIGNFPGKSVIGGFVIPFGQFPHDVALNSTEFGEAANLGFIPKVTVMNEGDTTETFNVTLTIGPWSSTKTVSSLIPFALRQVVFDACPLPAGDYSMNVCTQLASDMNVSNDCKAGIIKLLNLNKKAYGYCLNGWYSSTPSGPVSFSLSGQGILNSIANQSESHSFSGSTWANGIWYAIAYDSTMAPYGEFVTADTLTGARNIISTFPFPVTDISYNPVNNTMYAVGYASGTDYENNYNLYTIDMTNGALKWVGNCNSVGGLDGLAIDNAGNAFSVNKTTHQLGRINLTNGIWSPIGLTGFTGGYDGFDLDMEFDRETGFLYLCAFSGTYRRELLLADTITGHASLIGTFNGAADIRGLAIPCSQPDHDVAAYRIDFNEVADIGFVPKATVMNTGKNSETFNATMTIGTWTSTKTVTTLTPNATQQVIFDACPLPPGDYTVSLCTQLGADMLTSNDCKTGIIKLLDNLNKKVYASCTGSGTGNHPGGTISFNLNKPGVLHLLNDQDQMNMITGGTWANGTWYGSVYNPNQSYQFISIDTATGTRTVIGNMGVRMYGISFNPANNTMYGYSGAINGTNTDLYTIDMATGNPTFVITASGVFLEALAFDNAGNAYAIDDLTNRLGRLNLTTGAWTGFGNLGVGYVGWSGMEFDRETRQLYLCIMNQSIIQEELRLVDTITGGSYLIDKFPGWGTITGFAIPSIINAGLTADFSADTLTPPKNTDVIFTDQTTGGAISWSWSFVPGTVVYVNGTSSTSQNPHVQFTNGGLYSVTLIAGNGSSLYTTTKTDYLRAGISGIWTGNTSSDWTVTSNWDNYLVPDHLIDVVIPSSASVINWPTFTGSFTVGIQCKSLTLSDPTSQLTVIGALTILNGYTLTNQGNIDVK